MCAEKAQLDVQYQSYQSNQFTVNTALNSIVEENAKLVRPFNITKLSSI